MTTQNIAVLPQSITPTPGEAGFEVRSPCGRAWFVPLEQVQLDYAAFLQETDGIDAEAARSKAAAVGGFMRTWFSEQFDWNDAVTCGRQIKEASPEDIVRALDFYRSRADRRPADDCTAHGIAE